MKLKSVFSKIGVFALSIVFCLSLAGCGGGYGYTGGVAATVNGTAIQEDTVTKYIQDFRTSADLTSDEAWANWLIESSQTPESVRRQVIDYYVSQDIIKQAAKEYEVEVDSAKVDEQVNAMRKNYDTDKAWQEALATSGVTEEQYRESIEMGLLSRALLEKVIQDVDTSDDAGLLEFMNTYKDLFNGSKRSSHILLDAGDEALAEEIAQKLTAGQMTFEAAAKQYSKDTGSAANGGDVGWNTTNNFVEEYSAALDQISKGQITLTKSEFGIHIILCTEVLDIQGTPTSLSAYPAQIVDYMRTIFGSQKKSDDFQKWLEQYQADSDVVINEMPANVPYNVDLSKYENAQSEGTEEVVEEETVVESDNEADNLSAIETNNGE